MNAVYKAARAAYRNAQFPNFEVRAEPDCYPAVYANGKFVAVYVTREAARADIELQTAKADKFIGVGAAYA